MKGGIVFREGKVTRHGSKGLLAVDAAGKCDNAAIFTVLDTR
jgi:hypothetical protein